MDIYKLIGQVKFLMPRNNKLYFKVEILEVKREFGYILTKVKPVNENDITNSGWVRLKSLKNNPGESCHDPS